MAFLAKLRSVMNCVPPYVAWDQAACPQGEPLAWPSCAGRAEEHWLSSGLGPQWCPCSWEAARCPRPFAQRPAEHQPLLGRLLLANRLAQQVLYQVWRWIERVQWFEKYQLALGDVVLNRLRFTWMMARLPDAAGFLRARALFRQPLPWPLLAGLMPIGLPP